MCILYFRRSSQAKKPSSPPNFRSGTPWTIRSHVPLGKLPKRHVGRNVVIAGQREQFLQFVRVGRRVPRRDGPLAERFARIGNDQLHVEPDDVSESFALGAGAQRTVEAVQPRLGRGILDAAILAGQLRAEPDPPPRLAVDEQRGARESGRGLGTSVPSELPGEPVTPPVESSTSAQHRPRPFANAVSSESRSRLSAAPPAASRSTMT